jgi:hypothetical protein
MTYGVFQHCGNWISVTTDWTAYLNRYSWFSVAVFYPPICFQGTCQWFGYAAAAQVALYLRQLRLLDIRYNHIQTLPLSFGSLFMRSEPITMLISHNPLSLLRNEGFGYVGASIASGATIDDSEDIDVLSSETDSKTVATFVDAHVGLGHSVLLTKRLKHHGCVCLFQIAEFAVKRFRLKDAVDRVWVGPNFPRVFDVYEFMADVRREMEATGRDAMLDTMMRHAHRQLKKDFGIPTDKPAAALNIEGGAGCQPVQKPVKETTAVHRAAVYALRNGMVAP